MGKQGKPRKENGPMPPGKNMGSRHQGHVGGRGMPGKSSGNRKFKRGKNG